MSREPHPEWPEWMDLRTLEAYSDYSERQLRSFIALPTDPLPASRVEYGKIKVKRSNFDSWLERRPVEVEHVNVDKVVSEILQEL